ncbi:MAG TPA: DUF4350 domain-containing protein [Acidimicrobiales bacterium]
MSRTRSTGAVWGVLALAVVLVVGVLALAGSDDGDRALDPRSHERLGTSALVEVARGLGAEVTIADRVPATETGAGDGPAGPGTDVVLLLDDALGAGPADDLERWVDRGGTLVVLDPVSRFAPTVSAEVVGRGTETFGLSARCGIAALDGIDVDRAAPLHGGVLYDAPPGAGVCLELDPAGDVLGTGPGGGGAYLVAESSGRGTVVSVGGAGMFVNAALGEGANAAVAAALVAPRTGTDLLVLEPGPLAGAAGDAAGDTSGDSLIGLVPAGVVRLLVQLGIAFVLYAVWRARRLGAPVAEPRPVAVAASELVAATGVLLDHTGAHPHAVATLRADLHRRLAEHLGVAATTPPAELATVAAERVGVDPQRVLAALDGPVPADDAGLVEAARTIDLVREEVLDHG